GATQSMNVPKLPDNAVKNILCGAAPYSQLLKANRGMQRKSRNVIAIESNKSYLVTLFCPGAGQDGGGALGSAVTKGRNDQSQTHAFSCWPPVVARAVMIPSPAKETGKTTGRGSKKRLHRPGTSRGQYRLRPTCA